MTDEQEPDIRHALSHLHRVWGEMPYGALANLPWATGDPHREPLIDKINRLVAGFESLRDVLTRVAAEGTAREAELLAARHHRSTVLDAFRYFTTEPD